MESDPQEMNDDEILSILGSSEEKSTAASSKNKPSNEYQWQQESSQDSQEPKLNEEYLKKIFLAEKKEYNIKSFCWGIPGLILQNVSLIFIIARMREISETQTYAPSDQMVLNILRILVLLGTIALLIGLVYYTKYLNRHWAWCLLAFAPYGIFLLLLVKDKTEQLYSTDVSVSEEMTSAKTSKLALASLILGILGIVTFIPAIPGLICGILAIVNINKRPEVLKGKLLAIVGIVMSAFDFLIFLMMCLF